MMTAIALLLSSALGASDACGDILVQKRDLRVKESDRQYQLQVRLAGRWNTLLSSEHRLSDPRISLERATLAFLVEGDDGGWGLHLIGVDGRNPRELGQLNRKPAEICFDGEDRHLLLLSASGAVTPLPLD